MKKAIYGLLFTTLALIIILFAISIFGQDQEYVPGTYDILPDTTEQQEAQPIVEDPLATEPQDNLFVDEDLINPIATPQDQAPQDSPPSNEGTTDPILTGDDNSEVDPETRVNEGEGARSETGGTINDNGVFIAEGCQVTGCSSHVCANAGEDIITTCEWQDQYACYRQEGVQCMQDTDGQCGWVVDEELQMCLDTPPAQE